MAHEFSGSNKFKNILYVLDKKCAICGKKFHNIDEATIDHIIPRSKGGKNHWRNYQLAHAKCNVKKGNKIYA